MAPPLQVIRPNGLDEGIKAIPYCNVKRGSRADGMGDVLIDPILFPEPLQPGDHDSIRELCQSLKRSIAGCLSYKGILRNELKDAKPGAAKPLPNLPIYSLVLRLPPEYPNIQSLRCRLLRMSKAQCGFFERLSLAQKVAVAAMHAHNLPLTHKNIRPENVLLSYHDVGSGEDSGFATLVGFDIYPPGLRDACHPSWLEELYRSPTRAFKDWQAMQNDIYSLGVCLLEIGLWESFIKYGDWHDKGPKNMLVDTKEKFFEFPEFGPGATNNEERHRIENLHESSKAVRDLLHRLAEGKLLQEMGEPYSRIVKACIACSDVGNDDTKSPRFMSHVVDMLKKLKQYSMAPSIEMLRPDGLDGEIMAVSYCNTKWSLIGNEGGSMLIDPIMVSKPFKNHELAPIYELSKTLERSSPGRLSCKGILLNQLKDAKPDSAQPHPELPDLSLVFQLPPRYSNIQSLRCQLLGMSKAQCGPFARLLLAQQLAETVMPMHGSGLAHRNIRPETILVIDAEGELNDSFVALAGFDPFPPWFRDAGYLSWPREWYHPPKQTSAYQDSCEDMRRDVYSVGVCLLEIGLWESFIDYGDWRENFFESPRLGPGATNSGIKRVHQDPKGVSTFLRLLIRSKLKQEMGESYSRIVEGCLAGSDVENNDQETPEMVQNIAHVVSMLGSLSEKLVTKSDE